jgi:hypothetical protein
LRRVPDIAGKYYDLSNIAINDTNAWLANNHWGLQIAHLIVGEHKVADDTTKLYAQYWNNRLFDRFISSVGGIIRVNYERINF